MPMLGKKNVSLLCLEVLIVYVTIPEAAVLPTAS